MSRRDQWSAWHLFDTDGFFQRIALPLSGFTTACTAAADLGSIRAIVLETANDASSGVEFSAAGFGDGTVPIELQLLTVE